MTPDLVALGRRAVACPRWEWKARMRVVCFDWVVSLGGTIVARSGALCVEWEWDSPHRTSWDALLPDLSDNATRGAVLGLVREAWGVPTMSVQALADSQLWRLRRPHGWQTTKTYPSEFIDGSTEAESMIAALEAAPPKETP